MLDIRDKMPHLQTAYDHMYYEAKRCRFEAAKLETRAEVYEDCAARIEMAMEKEEKTSTP